MSLVRMGWESAVLIVYLLFGCMSSDIDSPAPPTRAEARAADLRAVQAVTGGLAGQGPERIVAIVVLDTVRADHLELYGYPRQTMPRLTAWASEGRTVLQARSPSSWTLPAHASLFTGRMPRVHGAYGLRKGEQGPAAHPLRRSADTLAERFLDGGWHTAAVVANQGFLGPQFGLSQGFEHYLCHQLPVTDRAPYPDAERVTDAALALVEAPWDGPLFLFVNYMDAHQPWVTDYAGRDEAAERWLGEGDAFEALLPDLLAGRVDAPAEAQAAWTAAYDAELGHLDAHLARLLDALSARGAWVAVTSDHGEFLGEHRLFEHSKDLYDEVVRVPMVVRGPEVVAGRDPSPAMLQDVGREALAHAGLPPLTGAQDLGGLQVSELFWSRRKGLQDPDYGARFDRARRLFVDGSHALLVSDALPPERYDLAADPGMTAPLSEAPWSAALEARARQYTEARPDPTGVGRWRFSD